MHNNGTEKNASFKLLFLEHFNYITSLEKGSSHAKFTACCFDFTAQHCEIADVKHFGTQKYMDNVKYIKELSLNVDEMDQISIKAECFFSSLLDHNLLLNTSDHTASLF